MAEQIKNRSGVYFEDRPAWVTALILYTLYIVHY